MQCPACQTGLELSVDFPEPAPGVSLAPSQRMTLTCPQCGYAESETIVPGTDGLDAGKWVESRESFHDHIQAFAEKCERALREGERDRLVEEHERLTGYLELIGRGEVPDTLANIELWAAKKRALKRLLAG